MASDKVGDKPHKEFTGEKPLVSHGRSPVYVKDGAHHRNRVALEEWEDMFYPAYEKCMTDLGYFNQNGEKFNNKPT